MVNQMLPLSEPPPPTPRNSALVVLSGGQDSTTCLYLAKQDFLYVHAITFNYGQRHRTEIDSASIVGQMANVASHEFIHSVTGLLAGTSPLVNPNIDVELYKDVTALPGGIEKTFVPMRNALFLVIAFNRAVAMGCGAIFTGVSEEDYGGYPDCRRPFLDAFDRMASAALSESVPYVPDIHAPLLHLDKKRTVQMAQTLPGCMDALAYSHTCYRGEFPPCGSCHACLLREKGFKAAGVVDPLIARSELFSVTKMGGHA